MIFDYNNYTINLKSLIKLSGQKKISILDFGCGKGVWNPKKVSIKKLNKIILYDKQKKLINFLKKKYKTKKIKINFNYKNILKKEKYNLVIFSSVIQYIEKKKLKDLIYQMYKNKPKKNFIFSDVPCMPRFLEFIILPLINLKRFIFVLKIFFLKKYKNLDYYTYKKKDFNIFKKDFNVNFYKNLHDLKLLRYTVILRSKK